MFETRGRNSEGRRGARTKGGYGWGKGSAPPRPGKFHAAHHPAVGPAADDNPNRAKREIGGEMLSVPTWKPALEEVLAASALLASEERMFYEY